VRLIKKHCPIVKTNLAAQNGQRRNFSFFAKATDAVSVGSHGKPWTFFWKKADILNNRFVPNEM